MPRDVLHPGEEDDEARDFMDAVDAAQGIGGGELRHHFPVEGGCHRRRQHAGQDGVHAHIAGPHFLGERLREAEQPRLGCRVVRLAARANLPQSHLAVIESGTVGLKLATLRKIFRALHGDLVIVARFRKTPAAMVAERIREVARKKIARVSGSMALEKQLPDDVMTKRLIKAEEERMLREPSTEIWEE